MKFESLDDDTRSIIDAMCLHTGKTKEQAILALVECGMISMMASVSPNRDAMMHRVYDAINKNEGLKKTAEVYCGVWSF